jgi:uncharacterized membrane protein
VLPIRLVRIALEAEALRLSQLARRTVKRIMLAGLAMVLALAALAFAHVAVWAWLRETLAAQWVALIFAGFDLLLAVVFAILASRSAPASVELEALAVRRRALDDAAGALTISTMLIRLVEEWLRPRKRE